MSFWRIVRAPIRHANRQIDRQERESWMIPRFPYSREARSVSTNRKFTANPATARRGRGISRWVQPTSSAGIRGAWNRSGLGKPRGRERERGVLPEWISWEQGAEEAAARPAQHQPRLAQYEEIEARGSSRGSAWAGICGVSLCRAWVSLSLSAVLDRAKRTKGGAGVGVLVGIKYRIGLCFWVTSPLMALAL